MKYSLVALLLMLNPMWASAQKNNLFADVGVVDANPGFSITDNYKFAKNFGVGIGLQGYDYSPTSNNNQFTPAIFGDLRFYFPRKKHMLFLFLDPGINFYQNNSSYHYTSSTVYEVPGNNGFYTGLGLGYFRRVTKRGSGLYASLKILSSTYTDDEYNTASHAHNNASYFDATGALSVGFKF